MVSKRHATSQPKGRGMTQQGLIRQASNAGARMFTEDGFKPRGKKLDRYNDTRENIGEYVMQLHPTKGERMISVKRTRAQMTMSAIQHSQKRISLAQMREFQING